MRTFRIAAAQVPSVRGDVERNIKTHAAAIAAAGKVRAAVLVFPELSLTGYEPDLAAQLAMSEFDNRLRSLAALAREHQMEVVVGAPLKTGGDKPALGAIVFTSDGATKTYSKMHLGTSERNFFVPGEVPLTLSVRGHAIGIAICADASQSSHPQSYADRGANIYVAGVFLNAEWYATDAPRLVAYAARHRMLVVMVNQAASVGTYTSVGKSAIWAPDGSLLVQAEGTEGALLIAACNNSVWHGEIMTM